MKCQVTIKRPDGRIETVIHPKVCCMTPTMWEQMKGAIKLAGKGECVSYLNIEETPFVIDPAEMERDRLVAGIEAAIEYRASGRDDTGRSYGMERTARETLKEFDRDHPDLVAKIKAEREAEEARKDEDFKASFIGRGLD